jgi:hypothetical protein
MFGLFKNKNENINNSLNQFNSDSFSQRCLEKIVEILNTVENPYGNSELFHSLLSLIQIGEDSTVLDYIKYVKTEVNHYNQDFIYIWLAKFNFRYNEIDKCQFYIKEIVDTKQKDFLVSELEQENFKEVKNSEFLKHKKVIIDEDIVTFFNFDRTQNEIIGLIDSIILAEEEKTKGNDNRLWNLAYQFEKIVIYLVNNNQIDNAVIFLDSFPNKAPKWNAISKIAIKIGENDYKTALKYLKSIKDSQVKAKSIVILALNQYKPDDYSKCIEIIDKLSSVQIDLKSKFYVRLIEKLISDNAFEKAFDLLDNVEGHDNDLYDALILIATKAIIENKEINTIDYCNHLKLVQNKVKYLSALICINNEVSKLSFKCQNNYFLPERFVNHEIEFWKIYNKN